MSKIETSSVRPRCDDEEGWELITPTNLEPLRRIRVYGLGGKLVNVYLEDDLGVPFKNASDIEDVLPKNGALQGIDKI
ncbi:MAG: hypothetical protein Q8P89_04620 [bacterium]|nr:hypothetical protein [bacterium]